MHRHRSALHAIVAVFIGLSAAVVLSACGGDADRSSIAPRTDTGARATETNARGAPAGCERPYSEDSPWNAPIGEKPAYHPRSARFVKRIPRPLTSDPTQYSYPVYRVTADTPLRAVRVTGVFSDVSDQRTLEIRQESTIRLPIPKGAAGAEGSDAQIILVNAATGDEWGAWRLRRSGSGWEVSNGYHYNTRWNGVPPREPDGSPFGSRGAGVPYLAGLVRRCELARGRIDHALAFAYDAPAPSHVYPATKSDGAGTEGLDVPEGARLQLDPALSTAEIKAFGCEGACLTIARALQKYGMYVIDNSGRSKVMLEYEDTAQWNGMVDESTVSPLPVSAFKVLRWARPAVASPDGDASRTCTIRGTDGDDELRGTRGDDVICGLDGDDRMAGGSGDDVLQGESGDDILSGGPGDDRLLGEGGRDRIDGGPGRDRLSGDADHDRLLARDGERDEVDGGPGSDRARVDRGTDALSSIFDVDSG